MKNFLKTFFIIIAALATSASAVFAYVSPGKPAGFVNDFAQILSAEQKTTLEARLNAFEKETGSEISVVTIAGLGDETIETYAVKLFEEWKIGKEKADNGLLLLVAPNEREVRVEVGYGLEGTVTDIASYNIINDAIIPEFKNGDYYAGIEKAVSIITGLITNDPEAFAYAERTEPRPDFSSFSGIAFIFLLQLIPVIIYSKSWWLGGVIGFILGFILFSSLIPAFVMTIVGLALDYVLSKKFGGKRPPGGRGGVWFGGMGGGRGSGGSSFGGFGGGSSGGGGASGHW